MKTYSSKSNAVRGYRTANPDSNLTREQLNDAVVELDGGFAVDPAKLEPVVTATRKRHIYKGVPWKRFSDEQEGATSAVRDFFEDYLAEAAEDGGERPSRKDFIAAAVAEGFAYYTARTQYQRWVNPPKPKAE